MLHKDVISGPQNKNTKCFIPLLNIVISVFLIMDCSDSDKQNKINCEDYKRNAELVGYWECITQIRDTGSLPYWLFNGSYDSCTSELLQCSLRSHFHFTDELFDSSHCRMKCPAEWDCIEAFQHPVSVRGYQVGYWFTIDDSLFLSYDFDCFSACSEKDYSVTGDDYSVTGTELVETEADSSSNQSCKSKCEVSSYSIKNDTLSLIANGDTIKYQKAPDL